MRQPTTFIFICPKTLNMKENIFSYCQARIYISFNVHGLRYSVSASGQKIGSSGLFPLSNLSQSVQKCSTFIYASLVPMYRAVFQILIIFQCTDKIYRLYQDIFNPLHLIFISRDNILISFYYKNIYEKITVILNLYSNVLILMTPYN